MDGKTVLQIYQKMNADRGNIETLWAEVLRYCYTWERPSWNAYGGNETSAGKRRATPVCTYPALYAQRLASSLMNSAFPSNDYWFDFALNGVDMSLHSDLREWCRKARDVVHEKMRQGSNFYQEAGSMMHGLVTMGTAGFYTYWRGGSLHFRYVPIHKNFFIARNADGEIDMAAVLHELTAKEAIEAYGEKVVGKQVRDGLVNNLDSAQKYRYVQLIYPKKTFGEKYNLAKGDAPFGDVTVEQDTGTVVREGGQTHFPFAVPRFFVASDDLYGRSPAMSAMPLIKAMNATRKTMIDAALRAIKPAVFMNSLVGKRISIEAGAVNYIANFDPNSVWTYPSPTSFPVGKDLLNEFNEELKHAFMIDVFQAIDSQDRMTATEITERVRQKVEAISPIVSRIQREFSGKVIMHALVLLIENGELESPPPSAAGANLNVQYVSNLDAMLRQGIASKTMTWVAQAAQVAQILSQSQELDTVVNADKILENLADCNMLPAGYLRSEEERAAIRQAAAEAQEEMQDSQIAVNDSQSMLNNAKAQAIQNGGQSAYNGLHL